MINISTLPLLDPELTLAGAKSNLAYIEALLVKNTSEFMELEVAKILAEITLKGLNEKLIKFSATWCNPCKQLAATLETTTLPFEMIDVDIDTDSAGLVQLMKVRGVPTMILVEGDSLQEIKRFIGVKSKADITAFLAGE